MSERDFLVFIEEDDDGTAPEDRIVLQVETPVQRPVRELEVNPEIELRIENTGGATARIGLAIGILGTALTLIGILAFSLTYPQRWFDARGALQHTEPLLRLTGALTAVGGVALVAGALLTFYGRRLQARAELVSLRVVERGPTGPTAKQA